MKMLEQIRLLPQNYYRVTISGVDSENHYVTDTVIYTDDQYLNFKTDTFVEICKLIENTKNMSGDLSQIDKDEFLYIDITKYKAIMHIGIDLYKNGVWYGVDIVDDDLDLSDGVANVTTMDIPTIINIQKDLIKKIVSSRFKVDVVEILFVPKSDSDGQSINEKKYSPKYVKVNYENIHIMANCDYNRYPNLDILAGVNFHIFIEHDALVKALPLLNENPDYKFGLTRYGGDEYKDIRSLSVVSKCDYDNDVKEEDPSETFFEEDLRSILNASGKITPGMDLSMIHAHIYEESNEIVDLNHCAQVADGKIFSICIANVSLNEDEYDEADKEGGYSFNIKLLIKAKQHLKNAVIFLNQEASYEDSLCCASSIFLAEYICGINNMRESGFNKIIATKSSILIREVLAELKKLNPADYGIVFDNSLFIIDDLNIHTI